MYLKNGLISFLKAKNVVFLILGVFLVSTSVAILTQLIVGYFGDRFTILHARAFPESIILILPVAWGLSQLITSDLSNAWVVWLTFPTAEIITAAVAVLLMKRIYASNEKRL